MSPRKPNNTLPASVGPKVLSLPDLSSSTDLSPSSIVDSKLEPTSTDYDRHLRTSSAATSNDQSSHHLLKNKTITHNSHNKNGGSYCGGRHAANLHWPPTPLNRRHEQPCPGKSLGQAHWQCTSDGWQPALPNLSACRSSRLKRLRDQLSSSADRTSSVQSLRELLDLVQSDEIFSSDLLSVLSLIQQLLSQGTTFNRGDDSAASTANHFGQNRLDHEKPRSRLELTVQLISTLLDERRRPILPVRLSAPMFGDRLLRLLQMAVGQLTAQLHSDGSTNLEAENLLLALHVLDPEMPITLLFPTSEDIRDGHWTQLQDSIHLPARALNDFASNGNCPVFLISSRFFLSLHVN